MEIIMKKAVILGCENSHADTFLKFIANDPKYSDYGGRGITVCKEWNGSFEIFRDWAITHGYEDGKGHDCSIDRINNDGNYEPENCRWTTAKVQANNQRPRRKKGE